MDTGTKATSGALSENARREARAQIVALGRVLETRHEPVAPAGSNADKMLAGEVYDPLDPELVTARARARDLCRQLNPTHESQDTERRRILRALFGKGDTVWMQPPFYCDYGGNIELGERVFFNFNCIVLDVCPVRTSRCLDQRCRSTRHFIHSTPSNGAERSSASQSRSGRTCG